MSLLSLTEFRERLRVAETAFDLADLMDGDEGISSCPCFSMTLREFRAKGHCWRASYRGSNDFDVPCRHAYVGLHYWGDPADGKRLAALLTAMNWYGRWPLKREGPA